MINRHIIKNTATKIKVAVIGAGYLGKFHAQKYAASPQAELVGLVDNDIKRADVLAQQLLSEGLCSEKVPVSHSIEDLATKVEKKAKKIEAVSIVVPTQAHYQIAVKCLERGMDCLIEKPFTATIEQADHLINIAKQKQLKIQVGHLERFNPAFLEVKQELADYAKPLFIEVHRLSSFQPRAAGVNVIFDLMIHDIDIILQLVKSDITKIEAHGIGVITDNIDIANAHISFASGSFANLTSSRISKKSERKMHVFAEKKYYTLDFGHQHLEGNRVVQEPLGQGRTIESQSFNIRRVDALESEIAYFLTSICQDTEPLVTGEQGKKALDVANQITEKITSRI